jgi:peroxiredoxin
MAKAFLRLGCTTLLTLTLVGACFISHERVASAQISGPRAWLGVELDDRGHGKGVRIEHVIRTSPAQAAGLRDGDVIVEIRGERVGCASDVVRIVSKRSAGERIDVAFLRGTTPFALAVVLVPMPPSDQMLRLDKTGTPAPTWPASLRPVSGDVPKSIEVMRGKVVVLDFWASWCIACKATSRRLSSLQARYGAQGLSVIGITDDPIVEASQGASSFGMKYAIASDESYATQRAFGVRALPTVFVIDKQGVIRDVSVGYDPGREPEVQALIEKLVAEPSGAR